MSKYRKNAPFLTIRGLDTAENEPCKDLQKVCKILQDLQKVCKMLQDLQIFLQKFRQTFWQTLNFSRIFLEFFGIFKKMFGIFCYRRITATERRRGAPP